MHDEELAAKAGLLEAVVEVAEVPLDLWPRIGVDDRRRETLELPHLGQDLRREGDGDRRILAGDERSYALLVRRIAQREKEADRDRLAAGVPKPGHGGPRLLLVQRDLDLPPIVDSLGDAEALMTRDDRKRRLE